MNETRTTEPDDARAYAPPRLRPVPVRTRLETLGLQYGNIADACSIHWHDNGEANCDP